MNAIIARPVVDASATCERQKTTRATANPAKDSEDTLNQDPMFTEPQDSRTEEAHTHIAAEGKNYAQLEDVLRFVATQAGIANTLLIQLQADTKISWEANALINATQSITQYIGAAADDALGGDISGDFDYWTYGPNFAKLGTGGRS